MPPTLFNKVCEITGKVQKTFTWLFERDIFQPFPLERLLDFSENESLYRQYYNFKSVVNLLF